MLNFVVSLLLFVTGVSASCPIPPHKFPLTLRTEDMTSSFDAGHVITYECRTGYVQETGNGKSTCIHEGNELNWTTPTLSCTKIICVVPDKPDNGDINEMDFSFGQSITFKCHRGYSMRSTDGSRRLNSYSRTCNQDGTWSGTTPSCKPVECPLLPDIARGDMSNKKNDYIYGDVVEYVCNDGYQLHGSKKRNCLSNGTWSGSDATCEDTVCLEPSSVEFEKLFPGVVSDHNGNDVAISINFNCLDGTMSVRSKCVESNGEGVWIPAPPECVKSTDATTVGTDTHSPVVITTTAAGNKIVTTDVTDAPATNTTVSPEVGEEGMKPWIVALLIVIPGGILLVCVVACLWKRSAKDRSRRHLRTPADDKNGATEMKNLNAPSGQV